MAEVNAVVTSQIARRLRRGHQIIGGDGIFTVRQRHFLDLRAQFPIDLQRFAHASLHFRIKPFVEMLAGDAESQRLNALLDRLCAGGRRTIDTGAVARIVAGDSVQEQSGVGYVMAEGTDLIERAGEGDESKA